MRIKVTPKIRIKVTPKHAIKVTPKRAERDRILGVREHDEFDAERQETMMALLDFLSQLES